MERVFKPIDLSQWKDWSFDDMMLIVKDYNKQFDDAMRNKNITAARRYLSLSSQALEIAKTKI